MTFEIDIDGEHCDIPDVTRSDARTEITDSGGEKRDWDEGRSLGRDEGYGSAARPRRLDDTNASPERNARQAQDQGDLDTETNNYGGGKSGRTPASTRYEREENAARPRKQKSTSANEKEGINVGDPKEKHPEKATRRNQSAAKNYKSNR
ncbi:MAG: hypothetical protein EB060_07915 [Proteobacteria bacterium]|nr:hypothetical protein [Pseudomonadota bacterium]